MTTVFASWLLLSSAMASSGCAVDFDGEPYIARVEKRFSVAGTPELTLATFDGSIEIRTWDRSEILVQVEKRGADQQAVDEIEIKAEQDGSRVWVEARRPAGRRPLVVVNFQASPAAKIIATCPRRTNLLARSGDGSIVLERVTGRIELRTSDGSVRGTALDGDLRVHTGDGSVKLGSVAGRLDLDTGDGSITVDGRLAAVRARTQDGSISLTADPGSAMTGAWDVTTGDGRVVISLPEGFSAELDAETGDGSVTVADFDTNVESTRTRRDAARMKLGSGGHSLRVRTGDGSIVVKRS